MKGLLTHLLAVLCGISLILLWPKTGDKTALHTEHVDRNDSIKARIVQASSITKLLDQTQSNQIQPVLRSSHSEPISREQLEGWLNSKKNNPHSFGEARVIAGLILDDHDLIRQGIDTDPENPHLLFIGATLTEFSKEEHLVMSTRLVAADPQNALSGFILAGHLLEAGQPEEAIQTLRKSNQSKKVYDFRTQTQLSTEDAYIAAGLAPNTAKSRSTLDLTIGYLSDLKTLAKSLKGMEGSMSLEDASELRELTALMGQRLSEESKSGTMIDRLIGIAIEEITLSGIPEQEPSPYNGMKIRQAKESIAADRKEIKDLIDDFDDMQNQLLNDPELMSRYIDRLRLRGEFSATKWLREETKL